MARAEMKANTKKKAAVLLAAVLVAAQAANAADTTYSEPEFLEFVNKELIDEDLKQIMDEIEHDEKAKEEATEEESTVTLIKEGDEIVIEEVPTP
ncbi:MAG: hypothetical protein IJ673_09645, partial [Treponema sp.]|nr:hypothetical protein [Treponema sp.]